MKWKKRAAQIKALQKKHGKDRGRSFPDLKTEKPGLAPVSNGFGVPSPKRELPGDARQFPIAAHHKQGYELLLPSEVKMVGKKP